MNFLHHQTKILITVVLKSNIPYEYLEINMGVIGIPSNSLKLVTFLCLSQARTKIAIGLSLTCSDIMWDLTIRWNFYLVVNYTTPTILVINYFNHNEVGPSYVKCEGNDYFCFVVAFALLDTWGRSWLYHHWHHCKKADIIKLFIFV